MTHKPCSRFARLAIVTTILIALAAHTVSAQFVVHDPTNYAQASAICTRRYTVGACPLIASQRIADASGDVEQGARVLGGN